MLESSLLPPVSWNLPWSPLLLIHLLDPLAKEYQVKYRVKFLSTVIFSFSNLRIFPFLSYFYEGTNVGIIDQWCFSVQYSYSTTLNSKPLATTMHVHEKKQSITKPNGNEPVKGRNEYCWGLKGKDGTIPPNPDYTDITTISQYLKNSFLWVLMALHISRVRIIQEEWKHLTLVFWGLWFLFSW